MGIVLTRDTAIKIALDHLPPGTRLTVYTRDSVGARTNVVAELRKETGGGIWADWQIIKRPKTADASLLPATRTDEEPEVIYASDIAEALNNNPDLWSAFDPR